MKRFLPLLITLFSLCWITNINSEEIYISRDANGVIIYSDQPKNGATPVTIDNTINVMPSVSQINNPKQTQVEAQKFKIKILQPIHEETIRNNNGSLTIIGEVFPEFFAGHTAQLYLDNLPYNQRQSTPLFNLTNIDRGEHNVKIELINETGTVIATSDKVTFYMHRALQ